MDGATHFFSPRDEDVHRWSDEENKDWDASKMATYAAMVDRMDHLSAP